MVAYRRAYPGSVYILLEEFIPVFHFIILRVDGGQVGQSLNRYSGHWGKLYNR